MKSTKLLTLYALVAIAMSSCHKTNPYNTSHPDHGKIEFVADWSDLKEEGIDIPEKYTIYVEGETSTISTNEKVFPTLIEPGKRSILIYSTTEKITLEPENSTAKVDVNDGIINGNIGRLYTLLLEDVLIEADKVIKVEGKLEPQVRKLVIILNVKGVSSSNVEIDDKTASLTGIASKWNYETNTAVIETNVRPEFKVYNEDEFRASMELLGIVPESVNGQHLSFGLIYSDKWGGKKEVKIGIDLTEFMKSFNDDKNTPLVLKCNVLRVNGEIAKWEVVEEDPQIVLWPD
jgi:hypothetical protein